MISIGEEACRNFAQSNQKDELRLLVDSGFWLYLPLKTRNDILNLLDESPPGDSQAQGF